jgi:hypothetical protein
VFTPFDSFGLQKFHQFRPRYEQFAAPCPARLEFAALSQPANAEIIHAKHVTMRIICRKYSFERVIADRRSG